MVILFSKQKGNIQNEITEILASHGANCITDKMVCCKNGKFTVINEHKKADIHINKGIAVMIDDTDGFNGQILPYGMTGICESTNKSALKIFENNRIPVITCGMNPKNTVTVSSLESNKMLLTLQRTLTAVNNDDIEPAEYRIELKKPYNRFSVMASAAILLLYGITPEAF